MVSLCTVLLGTSGRRQNKHLELLAGALFLRAVYMVPYLPPALVSVGLGFAWYVISRMARRLGSIGSPACPLGVAVAAVVKGPVLTRCQHSVSCRAVILA